MKDSEQYLKLFYKKNRMSLGPDGQLQTIYLFYKYLRREGSLTFEHILPL
jgi:hypothetical protein